MSILQSIPWWDQGRRLHQGDRACPATGWGGQDSDLWCGGNGLHDGGRNRCWRSQSQVRRGSGVSGADTLATRLLADYPDKISIPLDVALNKDGKRVEVSVTAIPKDLPIADIGLETIVDYSKELKDARITVMNGPAGVFEQDKFRLGTSELLKAAAESGYSIAGGGHSVAAIDQLGLESKFSHVSMGGGASITYLSGAPAGDRGPEKLRPEDAQGLKSSFKAAAQPPSPCIFAGGRRGLLGHQKRRQSCAPPSPS